MRNIIFAYFYPHRVCIIVKINSTFPSLGDASTKSTLSTAEGVGMTVLTSTQLSTSEEAILTQLL